MSDDKLIQSRFVTGPNDALASDDAYEVTENKVRSRAESIGSELLSELLGMLRIPFKALEEITEEVMDLVEALLDALLDRIKDFLDLLPFSISDLLGGDGGMSRQDIKDGGFLEFASLGDIWEYGDDIIDINPENRDVADAIRDLINDNRKMKPGYDRLDKAVDQGAETIVISKIVDEAIKAGIGPPLDEVLGNCSSDEVRRKICETVFPTIFDPKEKNEWNPRFPDGGSSDDNGVSDSTGSGGGSGGQTSGSGSGNSQGGSQGDVGGSSGSTGDGNGAPVTGTDDSRDSVTQKPSPNYPLDWDESEDSRYDDLVNGGDGSGNSSMGGDGSNSGSGSSDGSMNNGTGSSGNRPFDPDSDFPPGIRDNLPGWITGNKGDAPGFDWDIVDTIKKNVSSDRLMAKYPRLPGMVLHYYAYPKGDFSYQEEYDQLVELLDWLDEDWARSVRENLTIGRLFNFQDASRDAVDLFSRLEDSLFKEEAMVASTYFLNKVPRLLRAQYPDAAI